MIAYVQTQNGHEVGLSDGQLGFSFAPVLANLLPGLTKGITGEDASAGFYSFAERQRALEAATAKSRIGTVAVVVGGVVVVGLLIYLARK